VAVTATQPVLPADGKQWQGQRTGGPWERRAMNPGLTAGHQSSTGKHLFAVSMPSFRLRPFPEHHYPFLCRSAGRSPAADRYTPDTALRHGPGPSCAWAGGTTPRREPGGAMACFPVIPYASLLPADSR
jgi:hypothetical protein